MRLLDTENTQGSSENREEKQKSLKTKAKFFVRGGGKFTVQKTN